MFAPPEAARTPVLKHQSRVQTAIAGYVALSIAIHCRDVKRRAGGADSTLDRRWRYAISKRQIESLL
jgi:hypothetical protein